MWWSAAWGNTPRQRSWAIAPLPGGTSTTVFHWPPSPTKPILDYLDRLDVDVLTFEDTLDRGDLEIVVAGTESAITMVEGGAVEVPEADLEGERLVEAVE